MKALVFENIHTLPDFKEIVVSPKENEVEVNINSCSPKSQRHMDYQRPLSRIGTGHHHGC
jgi:hypothetical protein